MITFNITKDDITKEIQCTLKDNISSLKGTIVKEFNLTCKYSFDINTLNEYTIKNIS